MTTEATISCPSNRRLVPLNEDAARALVEEEAVSGITDADSEWLRSIWFACWSSPTPVARRTQTASFATDSSTNADAP